MNKEVKLITESNLENFEVIKENYDPNKPQTIKMKGVYLLSDSKNGNNRIYRYDDLKIAVDRFIDEKIKTNTALEECQHPSTTEINPDRVCCRTLSLVEDNKAWIGESVVLASDEKFGIKGTKCGDLVKSLLQFDCAIGHSSRGVGNVDESTGIVEDYQLICIDTVLSPSIGIFNQSNANRFVNGILESKKFIIDVHGDILEETYDNFEKSLEKLPNTFDSHKRADAIGERLVQFFNNFTK